MATTRDGKLTEVGSWVSLPPSTAFEVSRHNVERSVAFLEKSRFGP